MFEHIMWVPYLCGALASGLTGLALLVYRAIALEPVRTFPTAGVGFVGAGVVNALLAAAAAAPDDGRVLAVVVLSGLLTVVIGFVATFFAPAEPVDNG